MPKLEMPGAHADRRLPAARSTSPKIKGIHQAIRSGMLAAEHLAETGAPARASTRAGAPPPAARSCKRVRNFKPAFKRGLWFGIVNSALETVTGGTYAVDAEEQPPTSRA